MENSIREKFHVAYEFDIMAAYKNENLTAYKNENLTSFKLKFLLLFIDY
jgi:hypothetical protein